MIPDNLPAIIDTPDNQAARLAEIFIKSARSKNTESARRADLIIWLPWCAANGVDPLGGVRTAHVLAWMSALRDQGDSEPTQARRLSTVSSWHKWLLREGIGTINPVQLLLSSERPRSSQKLHQISPTTAPTAEQVALIQKAADADSPLSSALIALLATTGARVSEIVEANVEDIGQECGHTILTVRGKGGKTRPLPLAPGAWHRLSTYLESRASADEKLPVLSARQARPKRPLFMSPQSGERLTRHGAQRKITLLTKRAGLGHLHLTPHSFRHAYATDLLADGIPIYDVQRAMGHTDAKSTVYYDHGKLNTDRHPTYRRAAMLADRNGEQ